MCLVGVFAVFIGVALIKTSRSGSGNNQAFTRGDLNTLIGKPMPDIELFDKEGKPYSLNNVRGKNVVLFFNEGIMCYPACWNQVAQFGADPRFNSQDAVAFSVVVDQPNQWRQAMSKMPELASATILFDQGVKVSRSLGLLSLPSSMHKGSYPGHTYIILDKEGVVRFVYDDPSMAVNNDMINQKISSFNN